MTKLSLWTKSVPTRESFLTEARSPLVKEIRITPLVSQSRPEGSTTRAVHFLKFEAIRGPFRRRISFQMEITSHSASRLVSSNEQRRGDIVRQMIQAVRWGRYLQRELLAQDGPEIGPRIAVIGLDGDPLTEEDMARMMPLEGMARSLKMVPPSRINGNRKTVRIAPQEDTNSRILGLRMVRPREEPLETVMASRHTPSGRMKRAGGFRGI